MITIQAGYALVIDDEPANRDFLERLLQTASFKVIGASTGAEGLRSVKTIPQLALALVDQQLPDATGLEIIASLRADNPEALLVMATMHDDRSLIDEAFLKGADVFLVKPHGFMELYRRLKEVDSNTSVLRRLIIDQYGPRPYKGTGQLKMQTSKPVTQPWSPPNVAPSSAAVTKPSKPLTPVLLPPGASPATPLMTEVKPVPGTNSTQLLNNDETLPKRPGPERPDPRPA